MLANGVCGKKLPLQTVLIDSWYAWQTVIKHIEELGRTYYCPVKRTVLLMRRWKGPPPPK
jgi:hypothetical protein